MNVRIGVAASVIFWGVLALQVTGAAPQSQDRFDAVRQEISELKSLVLELAKRVEAMENRVAGLELRVQSTAVVPVRPRRIDQYEVIDVNVDDGMMIDALKSEKRIIIDEGMMIDALESEKRIRRKLEGELRMVPLFQPEPMDDPFAPGQRAVPDR